LSVTVVIFTITDFSGGGTWVDACAVDPDESLLEIGLLAAIIDVCEDNSVRFADLCVGLEILCQLATEEDITTGRCDAVGMFRVEDRHPGPIIHPIQLDLELGQVEVLWERYGVTKICKITTTSTISDTTKDRWSAESNLVRVGRRFPTSRPRRDTGIIVFGDVTV
tara:strand:- start:38048 stop:38545 length:498 start_codon:yes stop_codon:yes gene_type:complete